MTTFDLEAASTAERGFLCATTPFYIGVPYGGWKHSGAGREECFEELLSYTRIKNVNLRW